MSACSQWTSHSHIKWFHIWSSYTSLCQTDKVYFWISHKIPFSILSHLLENWRFHVWSNDTEHWFSSKMEIMHTEWIFWSNIWYLSCILCNQFLHNDCNSLLKANQEGGKLVYIMLMLENFFFLMLEKILLWNLSNRRKRRI